MVDVVGGVVADVEAYTTSKSSTLPCRESPLRISCLGSRRRAAADIAPLRRLATLDEWDVGDVCVCSGGVGVDVWREGVADGWAVTRLLPTSISSRLFRRFRDLLIPSGTCPWDGMLEVWDVVASGASRPTDFGVLEGPETFGVGRR